jgi:PAS domain S-box-containing protein
LRPRARERFNGGFRNRKEAAVQNQRSAAKSEVANRRKLQEALDALRLSEARYRDIVETQTELVSRYLPDTTVTFVNEAYCRFFGKTRDEIVGSSLLNQIPESSHRVARDYIESLLANPRTEIIEHEVLLPDGSVGWQQWVDHVIVGPDGRVKELQGIGRDITDRKRAEELLKRKEEALRESYGRIEDLAGRLLAAQETERARIGQELHDDLGQRLTALSWAIEALVRRIPPNSTIRSELARLASQSTALCHDVVRLSHELRPVVLQQFGLSVALKELCESTTIPDGVTVDFTGTSDSPRVALDIELSLYRVAQEALRNALIHSTSDRVTIQLSESGDELELSVSDRGRGFVVGSCDATTGLGVAGMVERMRNAGGTLHIASTPGDGTTVTARVPSRRVGAESTSWRFCAVGKKR